MFKLKKKNNYSIEYTVYIQQKVEQGLYIAAIYTCIFGAP